MNRLGDCGGEYRPNFLRAPAAPRSPVRRLQREIRPTARSRSPPPKRKTNPSWFRPHPGNGPRRRDRYKRKPSWRRRAQSLRPRKRHVRARPETPAQAETDDGRMAINLRIPGLLTGLQQREGARSRVADLPEGGGSPPRKTAAKHKRTMPVRIVETISEPYACSATIA